MKIKIDHIAKIEGHAGFTADIVGGNVTQARLQVLEGARLLEGILRGRYYNEVSQISARICGVCPVVHTLTSIKALENALGIEVSEQTILLRKLLMLGQIINSHALHIFFFSLSDFFGIKDDLKLIDKYPKKTKQAVSIREFGNQIIEIIGGRSIHPLTPAVGGFTKLPDVQKILKIGERAKEILPKTIELAEFFAKLKYPEFERETKFVNLTNKDEYAICNGEICISGKKAAGVENFMQKVNEFQVSEDAVKRTTLDEKPYMVGAIARINNNYKQLNKEAKKILKTSKIKLPNLNPFHNILAQAIEIVHCIEEVIALSKQSAAPLRKAVATKQSFAIAASNGIATPLSRGAHNDGRGYAAIEAPRGTLFYYYEIGDRGLVKNCNIITPTAQNLARLEEDLKIWLPQLKNLKKEQIKDKIRMLIRAYDPCLTCATH